MALHPSTTCQLLKCPEASLGLHRATALVCRLTRFAACKPSRTAPGAGYVHELPTSPFQGRTAVWYAMMGAVVVQSYVVPVPLKVAVL